MNELNIVIFFDSWWSTISKCEWDLIGEVEKGLRDKLDRNNYRMVTYLYNVTQKFLRVRDILSLQCEGEKIQELNNSGDLTKKIVGAITELKEYEPVFGSLDKTDRGIFIPFLPSDNFRFIKDGEVPARLLESGIFEAVTENDRLLIRQTPYLNLPLPIGLKQTCSATYIVGSYNLFSGLVKNIRKVFEFGVGCGYQIANYGVMHNEAKLFGIDYFEELCELAQGNISKLDNLHGLDISKRAKIKHGRWSNNNYDKFFEENAPYDIISFGFMLPSGFDLSTLVNYLGDEGIIIAPVCDEINGKVDPSIGFLNLAYKKEKKVSSAKVASVEFVAAIED